MFSLFTLCGSGRFVPEFVFPCLQKSVDRADISAPTKHSSLLVVNTFENTYVARFEYFRASEK